MKRFLVLLAVSTFVLPALQPAVVGAADVSINYFYDNLNGGNWYEVADYGYVWQPDVATNPTWRPYTDGYWAYTDVGWTWVSYEDFGWATYHYGRWARLADYGWVWIPGYEWGPAWVSWRTGGDYVGWAPLPPAGGDREAVYESQPVDSQVDAEYDIGPAYYNFIDMRYIGEPVLRDRIFAAEQNVVYVDQTVNVTNIAYTNGMFYNYGPDYSMVSAYSVRPIQRLTLERANIDPTQAVKMGNVTKVEGDRLILGSPTKLTRPATLIAPPKVKGKIDQPKFEKGWAGVTDPGTKARLEQKFRTENPKNIAKPSFPSKRGGAAASVNAPNAAPGAPGAPLGGKGKAKAEKFQGQQGTAGAVGSSIQPGGHGKKSKGQSLQNEVGPASTSGGQGETPSGIGKGKNNKVKDLRGQPAAATATGAENGPPATETGSGGGKGKHKAVRAAGVANPNAGEGTGQGAGKRNRKLEHASAQGNVNGPPPPTGEMGRRKGAVQAVRTEGVNQAGAGAKQRRGEIQGQPMGQGQPQGAPPGKGKKNKGQNSPPPR